MPAEYRDAVADGKKPDWKRLGAFHDNAGRTTVRCQSPYDLDRIEWDGWPLDPELHQDVARCDVLDPDDLSLDVWEFMRGRSSGG